MFDTFLNKVFNKKKESKKKEIPYFRDISPEEQERSVVNFSYFSFEKVLTSLSIITVVKSLYVAGIKNVNKFGYRLDEGEDKMVLKIFMHQILQGILQLYFNSIVYKYYRTFYLSMFVLPTVKDGLTLMDYDKLISINNLILISDAARSNMPIFKLFESCNKNPMILNEVVDVNDIAVKMFSYTESMSSTFTREVVHNSINVFIRDYFQILKEHKNWELISSFFSVYAVFFNERFSRLFYKTDGILKITQIKTVSAELMIALSIYEYLINDIKNNNLDFNNISISLCIVEEEKKRLFIDNIKKEVYTFIEKINLIKQMIEENKIENNVNEVDYGVNVIDLTSIFQRQQKLATVNKEIADIKGKL